MDIRNMFRLDGKNAIVIGGAGGIGEGIAEALAAFGANVSIASRKMEALLAGKTIHCVLEEQIVYDQLDANADAIWSLFLASG